MARCVGDDELSFGCGKIPIRHINGDALLAFGTQTVRQQAEVSRFKALLFARRFNGLQLIFKNALAVI